LAVFVRHGREGRGITIESLAANVGMSVNSRELVSAVKSLNGRGLIKQAGRDPMLGAPVAFRLARQIPRQYATAAKVATLPNRSNGKTNPEGILPRPDNSITPDVRTAVVRPA
jgi:hypothetical protein